MSDLEQLPQVWQDLINGLIAMAPYGDDVSPLHCEHDTLTVMADPKNFTDDELTELDRLGFFVGDSGTFQSFRFGSA